MVTGILFVVAIVPHDDTSEACKQMVDPKVVRIAGQYDLVNLAHQVQNADRFIRATAGSKLQQIATQIRFLQQQAREVLEQAKRDAQLHHAACNFQKRPGHIYHLYEKPNGQTYFSMLSPTDWGASQPHHHIGSFHLEMDMSWTPIEELERRSKEIKAIEHVLDSQDLRDAITYTMGNDDS